MESVRRNFLSRVNQQSGVRLNNLETECWEWEGCFGSGGYGLIQTNYAKEFGSQKAHRMSYWLFNGEFDKNLDVLHQCDNPTCVNPQHLRLGTQQDNNQERDERGRHVALRGVDHGNSKFAEDDVAEIHRRRLAGEEYKQIAQHYGCHRRTIERLCVGKTYDKNDLRNRVQEQKQERDQRVQQLRAEGQTYKQIAEQMGISQSKICVIINSLN